MPKGDAFGFKPEQKRSSRRQEGPFPIKGEFGGSVPNSLRTSNAESAWSRWRRGFELATADLATTAFEYPFQYQIPLPPGVQPTGDNLPFVAGVIKGYPTHNKELGIHWAATTLAGSLRFDNLTDQNGVPLSIESVYETDDFLTVKLAGTYDQSNPLPPPLFIPVPGSSTGLKPFVGNILEDRIIEVGGVPITRTTLNPNTQTRYGYTQYIFQDVRPYEGEIVLRKQGSVESTIDSVYTTPARIFPRVGRFFMNGARYCCSCQDFTRRQYYFVSTILGRRKSPTFPRTKPATLKPGRYEFMTTAGEIDSRVMQAATENRLMAIVAPTGYETIGIESFGASRPDNDPFNTDRDNPGIFSDFGNIYTRNTPSPEDPAVPGAVAESMPLYGDYDSLPPAARGQANRIIQSKDRWTPVLDEFRYCKHIYAMRFTDEVFPPEPSDLPVFGVDMVEWELNLVKETEKKQQKAIDNLMNYGLSAMDVPPMNCQSPIMAPMMQKLFNLPASFIRIANFTMFDRNGNAYRPGLGEKPANQ
jgi:hypothetical protein|tara:strand:+ start:3716 stop:5308 length:1593 start_codon:yes stop_codon:yes gene_type:complete